MTVRPRLVHLTTTDMSLDWLLGPQLVAFADAGYEVIGVSAAGSHVPALEAAGVRHVALRHATRAMAPGRDLLAMRELRSVFHELRPAIVHTHNPKPGIYGRFAARAAGVPVIVNTVHGLYALPEDRLAKRAVVYGLERLASSCSGAELVQNPEDLDTLRRIGVPADRLHLLGNGVDLARFDRDRLGAEVRVARRAEIGAEEDDVVIGIVGRMVAEKGYRELFAAAQLVHDRIRRARFVVIGPDDPDKDDAVTPAEIAAAERDAGITFLGARDDVDEWYLAMDVYALASHREGFPRSAMEAAAMSLPIVATDIRGCRQVVSDGETGYLVPVRDAVGLAEALGAIVVDDARRKAMSTAARIKAEREFDQQRVIDITLGVYEQLLGTTARDDRPRP